MLKSRPLVTVAGVSQILRGQDGRVIKASRFVRYSRLSCLGSTTRSHILSPHEKSIGWADGAKVTSRLYYGRRKPIFTWGRIAEWLRPADL